MNNIRKVPHMISKVGVRNFSLTELATISSSFGSNIGITLGILGGFYVIDNKIETKTNKLDNNIHEVCKDINSINININNINNTLLNIQNKMK